MPIQRVRSVLLVLMRSRWEPSGGRGDPGRRDLFLSPECCHCLTDVGGRTIEVERKGGQLDFISNPHDATVALKTRRSGFCCVSKDYKVISKPEVDVL